MKPSPRSDHSFFSQKFLKAAATKNIFFVKNRFFFVQKVTLKNAINLQRQEQKKSCPVYNKNCKFAVQINRASFDNSSLIYK